MKALVDLAIESGFGVSVIVYSGTQKNAFAQMGLGPERYITEMGVAGQATCITLSPKDEFETDENGLSFTEKSTREQVQIPWGFVGRIMITQTPSFEWPTVEALEAQDEEESKGAEVVCLASYRESRAGSL